MILLLQLSIIVFMAGSLFQMGLELSVRDAISGFRNLRFMFFGILFGFLLGPALAVVLARLLALEEPYALGLILLGMTPSAPFLPMMVTRARVDADYVPAIMLLAACGTVLVLPIAVPFLIENSAIGFQDVARPLLLLMLSPLAIGMAIYRVAPGSVDAILRIVRPVVKVATIVLLILCIIVYGEGFLAAAGSFAIAAQLIFLGGVTLASFVLSKGLERDQKCVLALAMSTRNVGAALAPLYSVAAIDQRAVVMVVLAVPAQLLCAFGAAWWFSRDSGKSRHATELSPGGSQSISGDPERPV